MTFEEQADLRLHPFDLLANGHVPTPDLQNPDVSVVGLALDLANVEARPHQVLGELDMEEHATHAVLGQERFQPGLAGRGSPALWPLPITHDQPQPDLELAPVLAEQCAEEMISGSRLCWAVR